MWTEQAIFTSIARAGQAGYHVVSRSAGVGDADVRALSTWSPAHGALIVDASNRTSVNFHPLPEGRFALSRTCEGPPEYSGRGGRQLYTHVLILDEPLLERSGSQPIAIYRDALALGHLHYRQEPAPTLPAVRLTGSYRNRSPKDWEDRARALKRTDLRALLGPLAGREFLRLRHVGNRIQLAECLLGLAPREVIATLSISTSLHPSPSRPYQLSLIG